MNIYLKIYLLGYLIAFIELIGLYADKDNRISWVELVVAIFVSILSWLIALALFIGGGIKNSRNDNDDDDNDNNNLAGT